VLPGLFALVAAPALVAAAIEPAGIGPTVVLGAAALAWVLRYGSDPAPAEATLLLALALYLFHTSAALAGAMPPTARIEPAVLLRWALHTVVALGLAGGLAAAVYALGRPSGSVSLELAGIVAVLVAAAVPAVLGRSR
jgi:hypothetical protein